MSDPKLLVLTRKDTDMRCLRWAPLLLVFATPLHAGPILVDPAGIYTPSPAGTPASLIVLNAGLWGASGVNIGGLQYAVDFLDDTCAAVYDGCDDLTDFAFHSAPDAIAAADALFTQVLLDTELGLFDTETWTIGNCGGVEQCRVAIPYADAAGIHIVWARNDARSERFDFIMALADLVFPWGTAFAWEGEEQMFGRFRPTPVPEPAPVPEPSTVFLLGAGALVLARRHLQRRHSATSNTPASGAAP